MNSRPVYHPEEKIPLDSSAVIRSKLARGEFKSSPTIFSTVSNLPQYNIFNYLDFEDLGHFILTSKANSLLITRYLSNENQFRLLMAMMLNKERLRSLESIHDKLSRAIMEKDLSAPKEKQSTPYLDIVCTSISNAADRLNPASSYFRKAPMPSGLAGYLLSTMTVTVLMIQFACSLPRLFFPRQNQTDKIYSDYFLNLPGSVAMANEISIILHIAITEIEKLTTRDVSSLLSDEENKLYRKVLELERPITGSALSYFLDDMRKGILKKSANNSQTTTSSDQIAFRKS